MLVSSSRTEKINRYLRKEARAFLAAAKRAQGKPRGEPVHGLRVSARRLRVVLRGAEEACPGGSAKIDLRKLRRSLRRLSRSAGRERELEVAERDAKSFGLAARGLRGHRKRAEKAVKRALRSRKTRKLTEEVERLLGGAGGPFRAFSFAPVYEELQRRRGSRSRSTKELHALRVAVKEARYALEAAGLPSRAMASLQEHLGRVHDLEVLQQLCGRHRRVADRSSFYRDKSRKALRSALKRVLPELRRL